MRRIKTKMVIVFLVVLAVSGSMSGLIRPFAQGNATAEPAATAVSTVSVDDLSVVSVDKLDMYAGPVGTLALMSPDGKHFAYLTLAQKNVCFYTPAGEQESCIDLSSSGLYSPGTIRWSPNSTKLALTENFLQRSQEPDIWIADMTTGQITDITDDGITGGSVTKQVQGDIDLSPVWSNDSSHLTFIRYVPDSGKFSAAIFTVSVAGGTPVQVGALDTKGNGKLPIYVLAVSPDELKIAYNLNTGQSDAPDSGVWIADADGKNPKQILKQDLPWLISFSSDGRYVLVNNHAAISPTDPTKSIVWIAPVDGSGGFQVDKDHRVISAAWEPSGEGLAYIVMEATATDSSGLYLASAPGKPGRLLFPGKFAAPTPQADLLTWNSDNSIMISTAGGKPLDVLHLGGK